MVTIATPIALALILATAILAGVSALIAKRRHPWWLSIIDLFTVLVAIAAVVVTFIAFSTYE